MLSPTFPFRSSSAHASAPVVPPRAALGSEVLHQAFSRAAGGRPIPGNTLRLLRDATENYPAWLDAIRSATRTIYFECYIIRDDEAGVMFADALTARARDGVRVRLLYDWLGAFGPARTPGGGQRDHW